jgi:opacity protein-like surface antigen
MRNQRYGAELIADFGPNVGIDSASSVLLFEDSHSANAYMFNFIGGLPFHAGRFTPYWSAGPGYIQFRGDVVDFNGDSAFESNGKFGWNIGLGLVSFAGHWGVRTDLRYYRANSDDSAPDFSSTEEVSKSLISGLTFWRANVGLAARW